MIDPLATTGWISAGKSGLDLLRVAFELLPRNADRERLVRALNEFERSLELANAKLANELGYPLCRCVFPPKPMLWDAARAAFLCQNGDCGRVEGG